MWRKTVGSVIALILTLTAGGAEAQVPERGVTVTPPGVTLRALGDFTPPTNVAASATIASVTLTWPAVAEAASYTVARALSAAGPYGSVTPAPILVSEPGVRQPRQLAGPRFTDTGVSANTTYYYTVTALRADGHWGVSAPVSVTTQPAVNPTNFKAIANGRDVTLSWDTMPEASYYWLVSGPGIMSQKLSATSLTVPNVAPGTHTYGLLAYYAGGTSADEANPVRATVTIGAPAIWGFADLHVHQFNNLGFGGLMLWGKPYGPMHEALQTCEAAHGTGGAGDLFGSAIALANEAGGIGHRVDGHPSYTGWPRWNTFSHQQVYADWLKRAHDGGLQLMVMLAGNNPAICTTANKPLGCNDMEAVGREIQGAKDMESTIDNQSGGPGRGWYRIVYSPSQAREAIGKGQLAVVLGAEVPGLFGCRVGGGCTPQSVRAELQKYYNLGLRQLNPIHNADNAFGGSAVYNPAFNLNNRVLAGDYFRVRDCSAEGVQFNFGTAFGTIPAQARGFLSTVFGEQYTPPSYPAGGHCNSLGLSQLGDFFIRELMHQKVLIDVDHMSWLTLDATLDIAEQHGYPVLASHTGFLDISHGEKRSEGQKRARDLQRIKGLGGIVAAITFQGKRAKTVNPASPIKHDCGNSSQSFAQAYLYAVWQTGFAPVALGSDFNGFAGQPSPRFGPEACNHGDKGSNPELNGRITYPIPVHGVPGRTLVPSVVGSKTFDYNVDGLAHIGMLPDLIQDLKQQGVRDQELEPLFRSAEGYIRMWERIESKSIAAPTITVPPQLVISVTPQTPSGTSLKLIVNATDKASGQARNGTVTISVERAGGSTTITGQTGQVLSHQSCHEFDTERKEWGEAVPCKGHVTVPGYPTASFDTPSPDVGVE